MSIRPMLHYNIFSHSPLFLSPSCQPMVKRRTTSSSYRASSYRRTRIAFIFRSCFNYIEVKIIIILVIICYILIAQVIFVIDREKYEMFFISCCTFIYCLRRNHPFLDAFNKIRIGIERGIERGHKVI